MADKTPGDAGYSAGKSGASASDNPHSRGIIESVLGGALAAGSGNLLNPLDGMDKDASDWEAARQAGESDAKEGK